MKSTTCKCVCPKGDSGEDFLIAVASSIMGGLISMLGLVIAKKIMEKKTP